MTSKLVVNTIEADTGISSVSFASSISLSSTSVFHLGDAGINIGADTNINRAGNGVLGFNINGSEKVRINSNGRVLIGTTTEGHSTADELTIANSSHTGITLRSGTTAQGNIYFADGTSGDAEYRGIVRYDHSENNMKIFTAGTERFRIHSAGQIGLSGANYGSSGQVLTSQGSSAAPQWATAAAGITMMDQWRLASDNNKGNNEVIDSNWERSDTFFAQIGTGMSESSGIFTFPQTGIYLILAQAAQSANNHSYAGFKVQISTDSGGSYSNLTYAYSNHLGGNCYANTHVHGVVDVTNESTFRLRMYTVTAGSTQYSGDTNGFRTGMTFIRLGDT